MRWFVVAALFVALLLLLRDRNFESRVPPGKYRIWRKQYELGPGEVLKLSR